MSAGRADGPGRCHPAIEFAGRWGLALAFLVAGALKASDPRAFFDDILNYRLVTPWMAYGVALLLPWLEIACALALLARRLVRGALALVTGMLAMFLAVVAGAWARGLDVECGCFGETIRRGTYAAILVQDLLLLGLALALLRCVGWREGARGRADPSP